MKPQKYNPSLGLQGNLENALWDIQYRKNEISNEVSSRFTADADNRIAVEQAITALDIATIECEQEATELDLRVTSLESEA